LRNIYAEYFASVREALSKIDKALLQITVALNEKGSRNQDRIFQEMPESTIQTGLN
jgi:hypothetical protein